MNRLVLFSLSFVLCLNSLHSTTFAMEDEDDTPSRRTRDLPSTLMHIPLLRMHFRRAQFIQQEAASNAQSAQPQETPEIQTPGNGMPLPSLSFMTNGVQVQTALQGEETQEQDQGNPNGQTSEAQQDQAQPQANNQVQPHIGRVPLHRARGFGFPFRRINPSIIGRIRQAHAEAQRARFIEAQRRRSIERKSARRQA